MVNIHTLLNQLDGQEAALLEQEFLAPCGKVRTQLAGLVYTFKPQPRDFQGWGIFQPKNAQNAQVTATADLPQIEAYLKSFPAFRVILVRLLQDKTWLAFPVNAGDMTQRLGWVKPVPVHLVTEGSAFDVAIAHPMTQTWWFETLDRRADPQPTECLRQASQQRTPPEQLSFKGLTPEMQIAYELATQTLDEFSQTVRDRNRLEQALKVGGGSLQQFSDQDDYWRVEWTTADGQRQMSAIAKSDLTVLSSGICLSGRDRDFDLESLVGVIEQQEEDWM